MRRSLLIALVACSLACKSKPSAEDIARIEAEDKAEQAAGDLSDPLPRIDEELKKRKEAALAETAALLVLRKKAGALWGGEGEDT